MATFTTKLNLEKPLGTEYYDIAVHNSNNDKIDANVIDTKLKNDCMAGGDIKGYIEYGTQHNVGEVWLSRNNKGEFKCLSANSDNYINASKWLQIDDLTNAGKLENLTTFTTTPLVKKNINILNVYNQISKTGRLVSLFLEFRVSASIPVSTAPIQLFTLTDDILPFSGSSPKCFLMPIVPASSTLTSETTVFEVNIDKSTKSLFISGHVGTRVANLNPNVYYQLNCTWCS